MMHLKRKMEDDSLRIYITDALKAISENTAKLCKEGMAMSLRYKDLLDKADANPAAEETADSVINRIKGKLDEMSKEE